MRIARSPVLQKRLSSRSSSPPHASSSSSISAASTPRSHASSHASGSKRAISQRSSRNAGGIGSGRCDGGFSSAQPNSPLQAISTCAAILPSAGTSVAAMRSRPAPLTSPCAGSPSTHTVASEFVTKRRSTREPAHASGTSAETSSHHVAHSGPSSMPSSASRSTPSGPVIRSREHGRVSGYTSVAASPRRLADALARVVGMGGHERGMLPVQAP